MENNNKKTLILSIVGILVLVIAVVGVSFAMYTFSGTGSKENVIQTGTVSMDFDSENENNFELSGKYSMSDAQGVAQTDNKADFGVKAEWGTTQMTIVYDLGITSITEGATLTDDYIKVALLDSDGNVVVGNKDGEGKLTSGVTVASLADKAGPNNLITNYGLTGGTLTTSGTTDSYTILAYVSDEYDLPTDTANSTTDQSGEDTTANLHKKTTKSETFSFKIGVKAAQK